MYRRIDLLKFFKMIRSIIYVFFIFFGTIVETTAQANIGIDVVSPLSKLDVHGAVNTDSVYKINSKTILNAGMFGSIFIGELAGENASFNAHERNVYVGYRSGRMNITGNMNSFVGSQAGEANLANNNSFFGANAGRESSSGSFNSFFGSSSGSHNITHQMNSFFGYMSGNAYGGTGDFNTLIGSMTGIWPFVGNNNTLIGYNSNPVSNATSTLDNSTAIGHQSRINASNQMRFGNGNITSIGGYVGWSNLSDGRFKKNIENNVPGLLFINKLKPVTYRLNLEKLDAYYKEPDSIVNDKAYKTARLNKEKIIQTGLIAQDVETAAKEIGYNFSGVDAPASPSGNYSLRYAEFVVPLIKAVQELSEGNEELKKEIRYIKDQLKKK